MIRKHLSNRKGLTLIELIVTLAIFGMVVMVAYPMMSFTFQTSREQLKQSNQRNETRVVSEHLKHDIEYAKELTLIDANTLRIINNDNVTINYYVDFDGGNTYLVRKQGTAVAYRDIQDVDFSIINKHLILARLKTDVMNNKYTDFKIYHWNTAIKKPGQSIHEYIIANKVFVLGNEVDISGSSTINGPDATVIIKKDLDLIGGGNAQFISTKFIYIEGDVDLSGSTGLGMLDRNSNIFIKGNCTMSGSANMYGKVVIDGNLTTTTPHLNGNFYVDGNVAFGDGNYDNMTGQIYYTGTLTKPSYITNLRATKVPIVEDILFPTISIPPLQSDSWYAERGYTSSTTPRDYMKFYGGDLDFKDGWKKDFSNVRVASSGNVILSGNVDVTGVIFAPNGYVEVNGSSTFKGLIIAQKVYVSGNAHVTFEAPKLTDLPF